MRHASYLGLLTILFALTAGILGLRSPSPALAAASSGDAVTVHYNGYRFQTNVSAPTVRGVLVELGLQVFETSKVFPTLETTIRPGITIFVDNPIWVTLQIATEERTHHTQATTVAELLAEAVFDLSPLDEVSPSHEQPLTTGSRVTITRVNEQTELRTEPIPYDTQTEDNPALLIGQTQLKIAGVTGEKELEYKLVFRNGEKVAEELVSERILIEPTAEVIERGTKAPIVAASSPAPKVVAGAATGSASWYGASGLVAASRDYPSGTRLRVTDLNDGQSVDVTVVTYGPAAWTGHLIDLSPDAFAALAPLGTGILRNIAVEPL